VRRATTALVALLAVLALGAAAGGFDAASAPGLESDWEPTTVPTDDPTGVPGTPPFQNKSAPSTPGGEAGGSYVASPPPATVADSGSGGVSPLFVAVFVGGVLASAVLALVLTGDDDRAPPPGSDPGEGDGDPRPTVDVTYDSPEDSAVVRAWNRLSTATGSGPTETPNETARRATHAGFPRDAVDRVTDHFQAVRYGGEPADADGREGEARDAIEAFDRVEGGDDA
jgi:hypothetical protein